MMQDAEDQTDEQKLLFLANMHSYCDQGILDYTTYILTATFEVDAMT